MQFTSIQSIATIRDDIDAIPKQPGVYKQYVDEAGLAYLEGVHPDTKESTPEGKILYLIYIGRTRNLYERFKSHLGITNTSHRSIIKGFISTLRVSYMANHKDIESLDETEKLNRFMDEHIYLCYMVTDDYIAVEKELIRSNSLPLNIKDNDHPFVKTNKERRKAIRERYQKEYDERDGK